MGVLAVLFAAGILYRLVFGGGSSIVLGITIACGIALLIYAVRLIRGRGARSRRTGSGYYAELMDEWLGRHRYRPIYPEPKVVSSEKVVCWERSGRPQTVVVLFREDGTARVLCRYRDDCGECVQEDLADR